MLFIESLISSKKHFGFFFFPFWRSLDKQDLITWHVMSDIVHEALSCDTVSVSVISFSHSCVRGWAPLTSPASAKISCLWLRLHAPCHFYDEENKYIDVETLEISFSMGPGLGYMAVVWVLQWWVTMLTRTRKLFLPFFRWFLLLFLFVSFFYPFISFFFPSFLDLLAPVEHNSVYTYPGPWVPDICVRVCVSVPTLHLCVHVRARECVRSEANETKSIPLSKFMLSCFRHTRQDVWRSLSANQQRLCSNPCFPGLRKQAAGRWLGNPEVMECINRQCVYCSRVLLTIHSINFFF